MKFSSSLLCCLSLALTSGMASASDKIFVNKRGNLIVRLSNHDSYRTLSFYGTGVANQVAYDLSTGDGEPVWGVLDNVTRNVVVRSNRGIDSIIFDNLQLPGNVTVITGKGDDNVVLNDTTVAGNLNIKPGGHDDYVELVGTTIFGKTDVRTDGGHDDVVLRGSALEGSVRIILGRGWDDLSVSETSFVYSAPLFHGQAHRDTYVDDGTNSFIGGAAKLKSFEKKLITDPADPIDPPADPVDPPADPIDPPADPVDPPADPIDPPADPIDPPADPVDPPADPIDPPTDPVDPPADPVDPPADPVDPPATFSVGATGPGGGIVFEVSADGTSGLEVAPDVLAGAVWGCVGFDITGTELADLSDAPAGQASSDLIADAACVAPAADAAAAYSTVVDNGTIADWYLPSANELVAIRGLNLLPGGAGTAYWSSTDDSALNAFRVLVIDNTNPLFDPAPSTSSKETVASVLPIRSF